MARRSLAEPEICGRVQGSFSVAGMRRCGSSAMRVILRCRKAAWHKVAIKRSSTVRFANHSQ
eukprot:1650211-Alexandrium_andersonii.AAC.1